MPDDPIVQMASDPDFGKLPLTEQRKALAAHDASFGQLGDADVTKFVKAHQGAAISTVPELPNIRAGTLPNPMQESGGNLSHALTAPKMGLESGLPSPAQVPENVGPMQTGAVLGSAVTNPLATAGTLAGSYLSGKGNRLIAKKLGVGEKGQDIAEGVGKVAGGIVAGSAGSMADAPLMKWLTSSKTLGAKLLQSASAKAGNAPVELSPRTNELVAKIVDESKLGGQPVKVITDLLDRLGPSTRLPAEAPPNPLTYNEARSLQSNASSLTPNENMSLKPKTKFLVSQFADSFGQDVQKAADQAGIGMEHGLGMKEFATASARNRALANAGQAAKPLVKAALGGGVGTLAGYGVYQAMKK